MLARAGAIVLAQRRPRRNAILCGTAAAMVTTSFFGGNSTFKNSKCDNSLQQLSSSSNETPNMSMLLLPTLQAGIRAARLVKTAILIVMDYEIAKLKPMIQGDEEIEHRRLEQEMEKREMELEKAQMAYANEEKDNESFQSLPVHERRKIKSQQKQQMEEAARLLAEAERELESMEGGSNKSKVHRKAANRLLELCHQNGGVYIKVGQHLANLDYLIPQEYIDVLSTLFDAAPRSEYDNVCRVIREDFNVADVDTLFDNFHPEPLASASLGQVHVAYDKVTGRKLAVKVQHYGLRETSAGDIFAVSTVVRFIDSIFEDFTFGWIADEIAPHLPKELDFVREGKNAELAAKHIEKTGLDCVVPKIIWNKTSSRVLTMEFEEGFKATDIAAIEKSGLNKQDIAKLVSSVFNAQMFLSGWVHCDPHPANVLLRNKNGKPQMVLVDHGLYKQIDDDFRIRYAQLWKSLMLADLKGIETSCKGLGIGKAFPLFAAMLTARPYDEIIERSKTGSFSAPSAAPESQADRAVIRGYAKQFLTDIFVLLGILPRQMLLLLKMNDCLRHIDFALGSPTNTLVVAGTYASKAVYDDETKKHRLSLSSRLQCWLGYMRVYLRIQLFDFGIWLTRQIPSIGLLKAS